MHLITLDRPADPSRNWRRAAAILTLFAVVYPLGCAMDDVRDARKASPNQPGNSATIGTDYSRLPKGKMYQPVPGTDVP